MVMINDEKRSNNEVKLHIFDDVIFALVPCVTLVLKGDYTKIIKPKDGIKTPLVCYRVDSLAFDKLIDKTVCIVREIVP